MPDMTKYAAGNVCELPGFAKYANIFTSQTFPLVHYPVYRYPSKYLTTLFHVQLNLPYKRETVIWSHIHPFLGLQFLHTLKLPAK